MIVWLWASIGVLTLVILGLLVKIHMLQRAAEEIGEAFADRLATDTKHADRHFRQGQAYAPSGGCRQCTASQAPGRAPQVPPGRHGTERR